MSTVSVVQYSSPHKNILQQNNTNRPVPEDRGRDTPKTSDRNIIVLRRKRKSSPEAENRLELVQTELAKLRTIRLAKTSQKPEFRPIVPNYVTNSDAGSYRKPRQTKREAIPVPSQKPQAISIARRNARERNRVKQVNEGFSTLRDRIPEHIAEVYQEEKGKKAAKKLSKVETLRMAVDYIRHLEKLLEYKPDDSWIIKTESLWNSSEETDFQESPNTPYDQTYVFPDLVEPESEVEDLSQRYEDRDENNSPLPSINETFPTRKLTAFYDTKYPLQFGMPFQDRNFLIDLSTKDAEV